MWGVAQGMGLCMAANPQSEPDPEPEDYKLLREIINTEFSGQAPQPSF